MRPKLILMLVLIALPAARSGGENEGNTLLRTTIEQWMGTMEKLQEEERRWSRERQVLIDNEEGLQSELEQVNTDIAAARGRLAEADTASQERLGQKRNFDAARDVFAQELGPLEDSALKIVPLLPTFFLEESSRLQSAILQLRKNAAADVGDKPGPNQRMAPVVQVLTEAERFNQKIWTTSEVLTVNGAEKNMKVVYFGLALAFAVDTDASVAMRGTPGTNGWSFANLEGESLPAEVLALVGAVDQSGEARMVALPVEISKEAK